MNVKNVCIIAIFSFSTAYAGKEKTFKIENGTNWTLICCAAVAGGAVVYQTYKYAFGDNPLDEVRRAQTKIKIDVNKLNKKTDHLTEQVDLVNKGMVKAQATLDEHGNQLSTLDKRAQEIIDHLIAIRKKQDEHSTQLQALDEQLKKLLESGAQKTDIEQCKTAIQELTEKQGKEFNAAFDRLETTYKVNTQSLKNEFINAQKTELTDFEKRIEKLVASQEFIANCCTQLKQELRQTIQEEFDNQRAAVGIEPKRVPFAQLKEMKRAQLKLQAS